MEENFDTINEVNREISDNTAKSKSKELNEH